jgi:hypothetical protein
MKVHLVQRFAHGKAEIGDQRLELGAARFGLRALLFEVLLQDLPISETVAKVLHSTGERTDFVLTFGPLTGCRHLGCGLLR